MGIKPHVSSPMPQQVPHQYRTANNGLDYLNKLIDHAEKIQAKKAGIYEGKANAAMEAILLGLVTALNEYADQPDEIQKIAELKKVFQTRVVETKLGAWLDKKPSTHDDYNHTLKDLDIPKPAPKVEARIFASPKEMTSLFKNKFQELRALAMPNKIQVAQLIDEKEEESIIKNKP